MNNIKLVVFDFDGVFTDGKIYVGENSEFKCYNGKDSYALKLLKDKNILSAVITADSKNILYKCRHIISRLDKCVTDTYDKLSVLDFLLKELHISWDQVAYMGDDLPDLPCLSKAVYSACPADAVQQVKQACSYICKNKGGDGAVREFVDIILSNLDNR